MAQVQQRAAALLHLVLSDDLGLHLDGPRDGVEQGVRLTRQNRTAMGLKPVEKVEVAQ